MKTIIFVLLNMFTQSEIKHITSVVRLEGTNPTELYKVGDEVHLNFPTKQMTLKGGFTDKLFIFEGGVWVDYGSEY